MMMMIRLTTYSQYIRYGGAELPSSILFIEAVNSSPLKSLNEQVNSLEFEYVVNVVISHLYDHNYVYYFLFPISHVLPIPFFIDLMCDWHSVSFL